MCLIFQENVNDIMLMEVTQELTNNVIILIVVKILYASIDSLAFFNLISYSASINFLLHILMLRNYYILPLFHTLTCR